MRWLVVFLLMGCAHTEKDPGTACVGGPSFAETTELEAGQASPVVVEIASCMSGSVRWVKKSCAVELTGSDLHITAVAKSRTPLSLSQTSDCNYIQTECETPALAAGEYTVHYGGLSETVTVPYEGPTICL